MHLQVGIKANACRADLLQRTESQRSYVVLRRLESVLFLFRNSFQFVFLLVLTRMLKRTTKMSSLCNYCVDKFLFFIQFFNCVSFGLCNGCLSQFAIFVKKLNRILKPVFYSSQKNQNRFNLIFINLKKHKYKIRVNYRRFLF